MLIKKSVGTHTAPTHPKFHYNNVGFTIPANYKMCQSGEKRVLLLVF